MKMESYIHNRNKISIRDVEGDIDIRQKKWDYIFDFLLKRTTSIYFRGTRLEYDDISLMTSIDLLVDQNLQLNEDDYFRVTFKVKESSVLISRGLINEVWSHYEYPCLIFLEKDLSQK